MTEATLEPVPKDKLETGDPSLSTTARDPWDEAVELRQRSLVDQLEFLEDLAIAAEVRHREAHSTEEFPLVEFLRRVGRKHDGSRIE